MEPALRRVVAQGLVRARPVVVVDPLIQGCLRCFERPEHLGGVELGAQRAVEPLDLAGRRR
jgi:hypothetical protein